MNPAEFVLARLDERQAALAGENCDCEPDETGPCCARQVQEDIAAERAILRLYDLAQGHIRPPGEFVEAMHKGYLKGLADAIEHLAGAHARHPDFDPAWAA